MQTACEQCGALFARRLYKRAKHHFCSQSCGGKFNSLRRKKGRRSKVEALLFSLLKEKYHTLTLIPNDTEMLNGLEVDIAVPDLKLAIEWNGIVHFKPIYGEEKLKSIQGRDADKLRIASEKDINLIVIPDFVSNEKFVREQFEHVCIIIDSLMQ